MGRPPGGQNPYLIDLLTYKVKQLFIGVDGLEREFSQDDFSRIAKAINDFAAQEKRPDLVETLTDGTMSSDLVRQFFAPDENEAFPDRYFSTAKTLDRYSLIVDQVDWETFCENEATLASGFKIDLTLIGRNKKDRRGYYESYYNEEKDRIRLSVLKRLGRSEGHFEPLPSTSFRMLKKAPYYVGSKRIEALNVLSTKVLTIKKPLAIIGPGGIGKTNFTLNLLHHERLVDKFGDQRFFISCEGIFTLEALISAIARCVGFQLTASRGNISHERMVLQYMKSNKQPVLFVIDNFETLYEKGFSLCEQFFEELGAVSSIIFTMRTESVPADLDVYAYLVDHISELEAVDLFSYLTDNYFEDENMIRTLVREVDFLPLAVELIAKRSKGVSNLTELYTAWEKMKLKLLRVEARKYEKNFNLELSISFSYESDRIGETDRLLFVALCNLPDLVPRNLVYRLFDEGFDHLDRLKGVGLVSDDASGYIKILAPIREYAITKRYNENTFYEELLNHYCSLALDFGNQIGMREANHAFDSQWGNIKHSIEQRIDSEIGISALCNCTDFVVDRNLGFIFYPLLIKAAEVSRANQWFSHLGNCRLRLGDISMSLHQHADAIGFYQSALDLFRFVGDKRQEAVCLEMLGDTYFIQNDNAPAYNYFLSSWRLYRQRRSISGEARALRKLGDVKFFEGSYSVAKSLYERSLVKFEAIDDLGQATVLRNLGEVARKFGNIVQARTAYSGALDMFRRAGDKLGAADCMLHLASIEKAHGDMSVARSYLLQIVEDYRRRGSLVGEGNCLLQLGEIEISEGRRDLGVETVKRALACYERANHRLGQANCLKVLSQTNKDRDPSLAKGQLDTAFKLFEQINNPTGCAICLVLLAELLVKLGAYGDAEKKYNQALNIYHGGGQLKEVGSVSYLLGEFFAEQGDEVKAKEYYCKAKQCWGQIGEDVLIEKFLPPILSCNET